SQHRCIRRDGTVIWVFVNARLVRDVLGMPQSTVAVVQDITARKAAEEALRHSEQRLRIAQRAAELCIWEWNLSSGRTEWSSEVYELLRMDRSAPPLTWESFKARIHPDDA